MEISIIFPNQILEYNPAAKGDRKIILYEAPIFFKELNFHKQKLMLQRASMRFYEDYLKKYGCDVEYVEFHQFDKMKDFFADLHKRGVKKIHHVETTDFLLETRIYRYCRENKIEQTVYPTSNFILKEKELEELFPKNKYMMNDFYIKLRKKYNILMEDGSKPVGGKWSYDAENRKKIPSGTQLPHINFPVWNLYVVEAENYIKKYFPDNYGTTKDFCYPVTFKEAIDFLDDFLIHRLKYFGAYQDAILSEETFLFHSIISPAMNAGLLSPEYVINRTLDFHQDYDYPLNSLEGFIRQILGWREYIRAGYILEGSKIRTKNFWKFERQMPISFWSGTTGIKPVDDSIKKVIKYGWCHHIERLMILGNFMMLCEIAPDDVYNWFMELFVDSYDWVMVPNVYGMSQNADGGMIATKPYISGSNYILKMSNYKKDDWCDIWDALYWRFVLVHRDQLAKNPRMKLIVHQADNMDKAKADEYIDKAGKYLSNL